MAGQGDKSLSERKLFLDTQLIPYARQTVSASVSNPLRS